MKRLCAFMMITWAAVTAANASSVVATVGGVPVTDTDITARVALMTRQGKNSTDNRRQALRNIIDDHVKLEYASRMNATPADKDVDAEIKRQNLTDLTGSQREMARSAIKADIAWQIVVARTVLPMVEITDDDIRNEKNAIMRETGLPLEMTIVRLIDIPADVAAKLTKPKSCDDAMDMARNLGGEPQKFTAVQYELAPEIRSRVAGLANLTWSPRVDGSVLLVCSSKKTAEYGKLDEIIKQNTMYKQALFLAEQQLKQLRRRAVVVINDDRYKL